MGRIVTIVFCGWRKLKVGSAIPSAVILVIVMITTVFVLIIHLFVTLIVTYGWMPADLTWESQDNMLRALLLRQSNITQAKLFAS